MYNIIPLIFILVSLGIIIIIVVRKFSDLSLLDVESIPEVKTNRFKEQIIKNRLKRNATKWTSKLVRWGLAFSESSNKLFSFLIKKLVSVKDEYRKDLKLSQGTGRGGADLAVMFDEIESLKKQNRLMDAEKKTIEIIGIDSKNVKAFKELAEIYALSHQYAEAEQTYGHIIRLLDASVSSSNYLPEFSPDTVSEKSRLYFELCLVQQEAGRLDQAAESISKALKLEPNNPRFLDIMIELSIIRKDKIKAYNACEHLVKVNPDNQKLIEFKERIALL